MSDNNLIVPQDRMDQLYQRIASHINQARTQIQYTIDVEMIKTYWLMGKDIIEEEQFGEARAQYGKAILQQLSARLQTAYGRGFSVDSLEKARKFFLIYQGDSESLNSATMSRNSDLPQFLPNLSWSHYVELMKVSRADARQFYAREASKNRWKVRELRRQISTFLFDRLAKSKDKEKLLQLAFKGQELINPEDAIKEPLVLEFLGLPENHRLSESELETLLIDHLQQFLLELGKGFAFMERQKRLTFDNDHYAADLVFYNVILKCYFILDLKTTKLTHGDLGQMQLYVNYFDKEIKTDDDNPTVGLVLCTSKSDKMVNYLLGEKAKQIFASTYQFHLPTEQELQGELERELRAIEYQENNIEPEFGENNEALNDSERDSHVK